MNEQNMHETPKVTAAELDDRELAKITGGKQGPKPSTKPGAGPGPVRK